MDEMVLVLAGCLVAVTLISATKYYRRLRRAQREYEKAHRVIDDIALSFNRQFKRGEARLEAVAYKVEGLSSKVETASAAADDVTLKFGDLRTKITGDFEEHVRLTLRLEEVEKTLHSAMTSQEAITSKITALEQQARQFPIGSEAGLEGVIPIRREKALAQLTGTEVSVLEMLASEGAKTAPEVRERVKLSREHTARLMKKLYEEGYLEREIGNIPFRYSVKREMEKFLKKENQPSQSS